jgi:transposase
MAVTIVDTSSPVTGGVDTHLDLNVAAALDGIGGLLGVEQFGTTTAGNKALLRWLNSFGMIAQVGVEGTGSYGAPLARYLRRVESWWSRSTAPTARIAGARARPT